MLRLRMLLPMILTAALTAIPAHAGDAARDGGLWRDWDAGFAEARGSGRMVLVDVYTDWCGWCRRMDRDVYSRADVRDYLARTFVPIRLNAESDAPARYQGRATTARGLATRFRVTGYPTTIFLRANGEHLANVPGYVPADRFLLLLKFVGDGHADRGERFDEFVRRSTSR